MISAPKINITAEVIGGFIKALMSGGEAAAEAYLIAQFPFLGNPFCKYILDWLIKDIGSALQTVLINQTTAVVINIQALGEQSAVVSAATALQLAQQSGDENAIAKALQDAKLAYQKLLTFDGIYNAP